MLPNTATEARRLGPWFHNLHLPDGTETRPDHELGDFPTIKWNSFKHELPRRLDGWTALDIGCNAGFYSFELARRGARVTAMDVDIHYLRQATWAADCYGLTDQIEFRRAHLYQLGQTNRTWDLVLFLGVFYHLRYPLLGLDIAARKTKRLMVFQSLSMPGGEIGETPPDLALEERVRLLDPGWPKAAFIEHRVARDPTNWWAPNRACVEALLRSSGMQVQSRPAHEIYICRPDAGIASNVWWAGNVDYEALFESSEVEAPPVFRLKARLSRTVRYFARKLREAGALPRSFVRRITPTRNPQLRQRNAAAASSDRKL